MCKVCGYKNHKSNQCSFQNCVCHKCRQKRRLAPVCSNKNRSFHNFIAEDSSADENIHSMCSLELGMKGNVKHNLVIEGTAISFEADFCFAHAAISEKLYLF